MKMALITLAASFCLLFTVQAAVKTEPDPKILQQRQSLPEHRQWLQTRLENLQNWDLLKAGMTIQEVGALVGPFESSMTRFLTNQIGKGLDEMEFKEVAGDGLPKIRLVFDTDGRLKSWQKSSTRFVRAARKTDGSTNAPQQLVWIKPGTFTMGSPSTEEGRKPAEGPQTQVTISRGFWISSSETTQEEYLAVMGSNPSWYIGDLKCPVENVTWSDATNYCGKLTARERTAGRLPADHEYRLPTEAEWEYCCRAGTTTRFSYGDDPGYTLLDEYACWCLVNSGIRTHPVGQLDPNPWGLFDMHGNVSEWCSDWYSKSLPGGSVTDPRGPNKGTARVVHGGNFGSDGSGCRSSLRYGSGPGRILTLGFRVVMAPNR